MLYVVPFEAKHLEVIEAGSEMIQQCVAQGSFNALEGPWSVTLMNSGKPVACGGAVEYWAERAYLWSFIGADVTKHNFLRCHKFAEQYIAGLPWRRLEAAVVEGFEPGMRWMSSLGFTCETPDTVMRAFSPDGQDCRLFAKVKS